MPINPWHCIAKCLFSYILNFKSCIFPFPLFVTTNMLKLIHFTNAFYHCVIGFESARQMSNLDLFLPLLGTTDVRKKILIGDEIIAYLSSPDNPPKCEDIGLFIDGLVSWINNSNFKVNFLNYWVFLELKKFCAVSIKLKCNPS